MALGRWKCHKAVTSCDVTCLWHFYCSQAFNPSEKRHKGEIAKLRDMVVAEARQGRSWNTFIFSHRDLRFYYARHISSEFTKLNLQKPKWYDNQTTIAVRRHGMYIPSSKFFAKFFLAFSHCFLLSEPPSIHFLWCWPGLYSCLWLFQGLWLCGSVDLCPCFVPALVCLPLGPCVPSGSTFLVLVPWSPGCSIIPTRMFNGSGLMPLPA